MLRITSACFAAVLVLAPSSFADVPDELTQNGGFETGDTSSWQYTSSGYSSFNGSSFQPNTGSFAGELFNAAPNSMAIIEQVNLGVGTVGPGDTIEVSFAARDVGSEDAEVFAVFQSETSSGEITAVEFLGGGALPVNGAWQTFAFTATAGPDVSGGVTVRFIADTGFSPYSFIDAFFDDVSVSKAVVQTYGSPKTNSLGCSPQIQATGSPSLSGPGSFLITANDILNQRNGLLFYGYGSASIPFLGGTLLVAPPLRRTPVQSSGGSSPPTMDCSGTFTFDFKSYAQSGVDPFLISGTTVSAQYWSRDPAIPDGSGSSLTNAVGFTLCD